MGDRVNKRQAPETAQPTGTVDVAAGWAALESNHATLRAALSTCDGLALSQVTLDHPFFGTMTVYQWVELMAAHEGRHTEQDQRRSGWYLAQPSQVKGQRAKAEVKGQKDWVKGQGLHLCPRTFALEPLPEPLPFALCL